jgi:hypothetical protein
MLTNGTNDPIKENSNTSATAETPRPPPPLPAKNINDDVIFSACASYNFGYSFFIIEQVTIKSLNKCN